MNPERLHHLAGCRAQIVGLRARFFTVNTIKFNVFNPLSRSMALIVQKYGGTSVGSPERIKNVARRVARWQAEGHQLVVVVSAMSGETNRLIALAREIQ